MGFHKEFFYVSTIYHSFLPTQYTLELFKDIN